MPTMSRSCAATAFHNPLTHTVWLQLPGEEAGRVLGTAATREGLGRVLASHGLIRTGDWLKAYGPVRSATVWTEVPA